MIEKEILLNDQGLKIICIVDKDNVSFDMDEDIAFLKDLIHVHQIQDYKMAYIGVKKFLKIRNDSVEKVYDITTTEIRILRALYNNMKAGGKKLELVEAFYRTKSKISDARKAFNSLKNINYKGWDNRQVLKTELHTHLIEILNPSELLDFCKAFDLTFPLDLNGYIDINSKNEYSYSELESSGYLSHVIDSLRLDPSKVSNFKELSHVNNNRRELLKRCALVYESLMSNDDEWINIELDMKRLEKELKDELLKAQSLPKGRKKSKTIDRINKKLTEVKHIKSNKALSEVYSLYLEMCLNKLQKEKVEYSEISFSNIRILEELSEKYKKDERFKLLLSIDRNKNIKEYNKASAKLESLLRNGKVIGVDIMGNESVLESEEYNSFKEKLEWILPVLHIYPNSVLRLHAGEFKDSTVNVLNTLKIIKELRNNINDKCKELFGEDWGIIPPPRIRIGHGINIEKNPELIDLIKEFDAVIEFNISSNYALGHVDDLSKLPIDFYDKNGIKYIFATDGGGMYSTSLLQEQNLANNLMMEDGEKRPVKKGDYVKNAISSEKEIILNKSLSNLPSKKDKDLYDKLMTTIKPKSEKVFKSYMEASETEDAIFGNLNDEMKLQIELDRIRRYINDSDINIEMDYIESRINQIEGYLNNNDTLRAKVMLYLLERECFSELDVSFTTIDYLAMGIDNTNQFEVSLRKLYSMIEDDYMNYDFNSSRFRR